MRVKIKQLEGKDLSQMRDFYARIPETERELEFIFDSSVYLEAAANALLYLPNHVTSVKFSGSYIICALYC
jgi:hypothetical protein